MCASTLNSYLSLLESNGELARIEVEADPLLEIAAITNRVCKQPEGGRALLFEKPTGCRFPVATNLFGSLSRVCLALQVKSLDDLTFRFTRLLEDLPEIKLPTLDHQIAALPDFSRFNPQLSNNLDPDLIQADQPDLPRFPFLQSWPGDGSAGGHGCYITLAQVFTISPDGGSPNCGLYRVQVRGARELAIQWKSGSGAARHAGQYRQQGKKMPVAIVLGGDPAMLFSAMFPLPGDLDEVAFAGFLRGEALQSAPCSTVPLLVPVGAEVVIEGYVDPDETVVEGPFGNHTGLYSPAAPAALMRVTAIRHRREPVIPATVVGPPPMEDCWMALAWERLLLAFLRKLVPALSDIHFPFEWIFHQSAIISLESPTPGMVRDMAASLWRLPWFSASRFLIFVDAADGSPDLSLAAWKCINLPESGQNLIHDRDTGRIAYDATGGRIQKSRVKADDSIARLVEQRWREYGLA